VAGQSKTTFVSAEDPEKMEIVLHFGKEAEVTPLPRTALPESVVTFGKTRSPGMEEMQNVLLRDVTFGKVFG
jgi:hypothetical protein